MPSQVPILCRMQNGIRWLSPFHMSHFWSREMQKHHLSLTNPGGAGLFTTEAVLPLPPKQVMGLTFLLFNILAEARHLFLPPALEGGKAQSQRAEALNKLAMGRTFFEPTRAELVLHQAVRGVSITELRTVLVCICHSFKF